MQIHVLHLEEVDILEKYNLPKFGAIKNRIFERNQIYNLKPSHQKILQTQKALPANSTKYLRRNNPNLTRSLSENRKRQHLSTHFRKQT